MKEIFAQQKQEEEALLEFIRQEEKNLALQNQFGHDLKMQEERP
jgi:hypothetical protein